MIRRKKKSHKKKIFHHIHPYSLFNPSKLTTYNNSNEKLLKQRTEEGLIFILAGPPPQAISPVND
jgi:hypothetical protein